MDFKKYSSNLEALEESGGTLPHVLPYPERGMGPRSRIALPALAAVLLVALILVVALGGGLSGSSPKSLTSAPSSGFDGAPLPPGIHASEFTLTDQNGRRVSLAAERGQVTVLTFLYSSCGAACVVIAQQIRGALDELHGTVPVLIVSADPRTDTSTNVRRFLAEVSLSGRVHYLTGPAEELRSVWRAYHVVPASAGAAAFGRYASVLLIDRSGKERVLFQSEQLTPEALSHDIERLQGG